MPHIIVEYSANLDHRIDAGKLVADLHQAVIDSGIAEVAAIRTRAERRDAFKVADGAPDNAFVHVVMRLRTGRTKEVLQRMADTLLAATDRNLQAAYAIHPVAITVEMEEISNLTVRKNTIREGERTA